MEIRVVKKVEPATFLELEEFEKANKIKLPCALKELWLKHNPIYLQGTVVYYKQDKKYYIDRFYPFNKKYDMSFQFVYSSLLDYLENKFLSFACDPGDWQFLISLTKDTYGQVFLCRMDDVIPNSLDKITDNFEEFINGLKTEEEEACS